LTVRTHTPTESWLIDEFTRRETIDAHEHLPPERVLLAEHADAPGAGAVARGAMVSAKCRRGVWGAPHARSVSIPVSNIHFTARSIVSSGVYRGLYPRSDDILEISGHMCSRKW